MYGFTRCDVRDAGLHRHDPVAIKNGKRSTWYTGRPASLF
jgi:hypothetical protein